MPSQPLWLQGLMPTMLKQSWKPSVGTAFPKVPFKSKWKCNSCRGNKPVLPISRKLPPRLKRLLNTVTK